MGTLGSYCEGAVKFYDWKFFKALVYGINRIIEILRSMEFDLIHNGFY